MPEHGCQVIGSTCQDAVCLREILALGEAIGRLRAYPDSRGTRVLESTLFAEVLDLLKPEPSADAVVEKPKDNGERMLEIASAWAFRPKVPLDLKFAASRKS